MTFNPKNHHTGIRRQLYEMNGEFFVYKGKGEKMIQVKLYVPLNDKWCEFVEDLNALGYELGHDKTRTKKFWTLNEDEVEWEIWE